MILKSRIALKVEGKNINRFIKRLRTNKVDILKIKYNSKNEVHITIYKKDYNKVLKIKTIYEIYEEEIFGFIKIKKTIIKSKHIILFIIVFSLFFITLTNITFDIEIIHSNKNLRNIIKKELTNNGIYKYSFKKNYSEIKKIKEKILNKYPDKIEWLEIDRKGIKYIIRVEERKIYKKEDSNAPRNIIAKKSGIIKKVVAYKGDIVKDMDDYVEKGELIINGDLVFNNEIKGKVRAEGKVYAEVWYKTKISYPYIVNKRKLTGEKKKVYTLKILNKNFELTLNKFKYKKIKEKTIVSHKLLPIAFTKQKQYQLEQNFQIMTREEALECAKKRLIDEINKGLKKDEYIIRSAYLKSNANNSTIDVEMFFAIYEDITDYQEIGD